MINTNKDMCKSVFCIVGLVVATIGLVPPRYVEAEVGSDCTEEVQDLVCAHVIECTGFLWWKSCTRTVIYYEGEH